MNTSRSFMAVRPLPPLKVSANSARESRKKMIGHSRPMTAWALTLQFLEKPGAGVGPEKVRAAGRDPQSLGRLFDREPREVAKLHQFGGLRVGCGEFRQGFVQRQHLVRLLWGGEVEAIGLDPLPISAALEAALVPRLLDEDAAHGL